MSESTQPAGGFAYDPAFDRNIGWVTAAEQQLLRTRRVAIAGLGGVGGSHLLTLTRLGVGAFHIADLDVFELVNFNRQAGATVASLGRPKVEVLAEMARAINPELDLTLFPRGVDASNLDEFLSGVDLFVDGFDFFAVDIRARTFARCAELGILAITAAPIGMGTAYLVFLPGQMTFEEYFRLEGLPDPRRYVNFLAGLTPRGFHRGYLVDPSRVDLARHRGPSTPMACELAAGVAGTEALKVLLRRGNVKAAPWYHQFDAYTGRWHRGRLLWGNRGPLQRLKLQLGYRMVERMSQTTPPAPARTPANDLERIVDQARWAPSGDNLQTWRFQVARPDSLFIYAWDTREHCVYDLRGRATQIAVGALLESIDLAADQQGQRATFERVADARETRLTYRVTVTEDPAVKPNPLAPFVPIRATQRRPMSTRPLNPAEKSALESAAGDAFEVRWIEPLGTRIQLARLLSRNAKLRLTLPEAYATHRSIIEWDARFSEDRLPDQAVGLDPVGTKLMRWAMASWERVSFLNRYLAGTAIPRLQLDLIPGIACAAHFLILGRKPLATVEDYVAAGRAWQRLWLTATKLGLWSQPEMTPLIFRSYVREGVPFTKDPACQRLAEDLANRLDATWGKDVADRAVVLARIGAGPAPTTRSLRLPLDKLLVTEAPP